MWLVTNRGFYSGIAHRDDPEVIMVRARTDRHLEAIKDLLPEGTQIVKTAHADYPCRVIITRAAWVELCTALAGEVDYPNFKDSVDDRARGKSKKARRDASYDHSVYMSVWGVLRRLTSQREHAGRGREHGRRSRPAGERTLPNEDTLFAFDPWPSHDPLRPSGVPRDEPRGVEGEPGICPQHGPQPGYVYRSGYGPSAYAQLVCGVPSRDGGQCNQPLA
jgi:hypothetical protein